MLLVLSGWFVNPILKCMSFACHNLLPACTTHTLSKPGSSHPELHTQQRFLYRNEQILILPNHIVCCNCLFYSQHSGLNRPLSRWPPWLSPASLLQVALLFYIQRLNTQTNALKLHWQTAQGYCPAASLKSGLETYICKKKKKKIC